jgi:hypothetical protein
MANVLFAVQPAIGHLNPLLTIARQMRSDGHAIVFITPSAPAKITKVITDNGFFQQPWWGKIQEEVFLR